MEIEKYLNTALQNEELYQLECRKKSEDKHKKELKKIGRDNFIRNCIFFPIFCTVIMSITCLLSCLLGASWSIFLPGIITALVLSIIFILNEL